MSRYFGPIPYVSLSGYERIRRRAEKKNLKARGIPYPKLASIGLIELTAITVPEWAKAKRIKGLTITDTSVWLRRISARKLESEDRAAGGKPRITFTEMRSCKICKRLLLGQDAEWRQRLDKKWEGFRIPCGPDCVGIERDNIDFSQQQKLARQRKGK